MAKKLDISKAKENMKEFLDQAGESAKILSDQATGGAKAVFNTAKTGIAKAEDAAVNALDQNSDGTVDIFDIIILALKAPGVHVDRAKFLKKELFKNHTQDIIEKAIATNPAQAGITLQEVDRIADDVIKFERNCVTGISAALGAPGGFAMAATIPADIVQYYGYTLRTAQKLLYLYGFPTLDVSDAEGLQLDSKTMNELVICLGIMYGVAGANNAIKVLAKALAVGVEKKLVKTALTKGAIYPIVKSVAKWFGVSLTKQIFSKTVGGVIPVVGGIVGGGITFAAFKPCCKRLQAALQDTMLSNPIHVETEEEKEMIDDIISGDIVEGDFEEIPEEKDILDFSKDDPFPEKTEDN